jgi:ABC-type branched-subunit amino acid transport system substrate-binding protein/predicted negative regulator of RcsB-dependent stress response
MAPPRLWLSFVLVVVLVAGCPRRFDPRADEIHSPNAAAEADYRAAQRQFQARDYAAASTAVHKFSERYGTTETLSPWVRLLEARIAAATGQLQPARELLTPLGDASDGKLAAAARFELGLVAHRMGDFPAAIATLAPFSAQIVDGEEATELHAVLADSQLHEGRIREALAEYEQFYRRARPLEQAYMQTQVRALLPKLPPSEQADLATRFALSAPASNTAPTGKAERQAGLRVGIVLPLSGKDRALGERVLRGAVWSARGNHLPGGGQPAQLSVEILARDSSGSAAAAAAAVGDLVREGAQVVVASPVKAEAAAIAKAAAERRVPVLHLSAPTAPGPASPGSASFQLLYSNEERAARLAGQLRASGLTSVAVLAPATPYGQSMTRAFVEALQGSSVQVRGQLSFPATTNTFTAPAKQVIELAPQAIFIPATAAQLELIAGQLAALAGLATQRVEKREAEPPIRLVLSTVEGLGPKLLSSSGRYLQGAVLAPVTTAGLPLVPAETRFAGYAQDGGSEPGALDGIGFDAIETLRTACVGSNPGPGPCSSERLQASLTLLTATGTTGDIAFSPTGQRRGQPLLLRVEGQALRVLR